MFDFLSNEVFQIVVITALFVIGVMLFMLYKRPIENMSQYLDDIDYRIDKMNKKLDELTNTFVNGLMVDDDEEDNDNASDTSDNSSIVKSKYGVSSSSNNNDESEIEKEQITDNLPKNINSLNYEGIEFSDIPNFSTDTSVLEEENNELHKLAEDQELSEEDGGKKRVHIIKRIIQPEE